MNYTTSIEQIQALSPCERIAGYIMWSAKLSMLGAKLRKDNRPDTDWTKEENAKWDSVCDELEIWYYALTSEEYNAIKPLECILSKLSCAVYPLKIRTKVFQTADDFNNFLILV